VNGAVSLRIRVEEYLALRRALGYKLQTEGRMLLNFADRLDASGQSTVTVQAALDWASEPRLASVQHRSRRLGVVRGFAGYLVAFDATCEIPQPGLLPARAHRPTPYLYSEADVQAIVHAAGTIAAALPAATMGALISLIAASGLRLGEALALDCADVDLEHAVLVVTGKNDRTRMVPLHATTVTMLAGYAARRDHLRPAPVSSAFFISTTGHRMPESGAQQIFARLLVLAEVPTPAGRRRPRIHDLRHTFAVNTLISWYRAGIDVQAHLPVLSTFLGHSDPESTYWYLQAAPELLALAAKRLENPPPEVIPAAVEES
jgi:integrase/recombinase XerD